MWPIYNSSELGEVKSHVILAEFLLEILIVFTKCCRKHQQKYQTGLNTFVLSLDKIILRHFWNPDWIQMSKNKDPDWTFDKVSAYKVLDEQR